MKKLAFFFAFSAFALTTFAQIQNGGTTSPNGTQRPNDMQHPNHSQNPNGTQRPVDMQHRDQSQNANGMRNRDNWQHDSLHMSRMSNVRSTFSKTYPNTEDVRWDMEEDGNYRGEFTNVDKRRTSVMYDKNGTLMETQMDVTDKDLPLAFRNSWKGKKTQRIQKMTDSKGKVTYAVTEIYDTNGNPIK